MQSMQSVLATSVMPIEAQRDALARVFAHGGLEIKANPALESWKVFDERVPCMAIVTPKRSKLVVNEFAPERLFIPTLGRMGFEVEDSVGGEDSGMSHASKHVRYMPAVDHFFAGLETYFVGDFMVLPVRFDIVGLAPFEARKRIIEEGNIPLDPLALLSYLYTHQTMLDDAVLWFDALAVEVSPEGNGKYKDTCYFDRRGRYLLNYDWNWGTRKRLFRIAPYIVTAALPH